jgi:hypothetical protein
MSEGTFLEALRRDATEIREGRREISIEVPARPRDGAPRTGSRAVRYTDDIVTSPSGADIMRVPSNDDEGLVQILEGLLAHLKSHQTPRSGPAGALRAGPARPTEEDR